MSEPKYSDFSTDYNEVIRKLIVAAEKWLQEHPGARPRITKSHRVAGVPNPGNHDARRLLAAIDAEADKLVDVSGAQINQALRIAVMRHNAHLRARHRLLDPTLKSILFMVVTGIICALVLGWILVSCSPDSQ